MNWVVVICQVIGNILYLAYLLMLWLVVRIVQRVRSQMRSEKLMHEVREEGVLQNAGKVS